MQSEQVSAFVHVYNKKQCAIKMLLSNADAIQLDGEKAYMMKLEKEMELVSWLGRSMRSERCG
jgi:hypothetical protein